MILYCAADLLWATKIKATADAIGVPCRPARTVEMLDARLADSEVRALIVDTEAGPVTLDLIARLRAAPGGDRARVVAFGPHVDTAALQAARQAGADSVMTRGAFAQRLPAVLEELARGPTGTELGGRGG